MKRIKKLTLNELEEYFDVLSEDECRNIIGGWYCFSYCLDYLGIPGEYFNLYYGAYMAVLNMQVELTGNMH